MNDDKNNFDLLVILATSILIIMIGLTMFVRIVHGKYDPTSQIVTFESVEEQIRSEMQVFP